MVRRSFRVGLRLGLLAGVIVALAKLVQSRRSGREEAFAPPASDAAWPPLQSDPVTVEPPAPTTVPERIPPVRRAPVEPPPPTSPPPPHSPPPPPAAAAPAASRPAAVEVPPMAPAPSSPGAASPALEEAEEPVPTPPAGSPAPAGVAAEPVAKAAKVVKRARQPVRKAAARKVAPAQATAPAAPVPVKARVRKRRQLPWVEPFGTDTPTSHPVKAKLSSMLYHLPGMAFYDRTRPDRCYVDAEAAEADGFIRAKR